MMMMMMITMFITMVIMMMIMMMSDKNSQKNHPIIDIRLIGRQRRGKQKCFYLPFDGICQMQSLKPCRNKEWLMLASYSNVSSTTDFAE